LLIIYEYIDNNVDSDYNLNIIYHYLDNDHRLRIAQ